MDAQTWNRANPPAANTNGCRTTLPSEKVDCQYCRQLIGEGDVVYFDRDKDCLHQYCSDDCRSLSQELRHLSADKHGTIEGYPCSDPYDV